MKKKINNVISYLVGNYRYFIYHKPKLRFLIRTHIQEQYKLRVKLMNPECYKQGSCVACGCVTTKLQFANKSCDRGCYPKMLDRTTWDMFKNTIIKYKDEMGIWKIKIETQTDTTYIFLNSKLKKRLYGKIF